MTAHSPRLLVAISPHGFGHLAQVAAVVNTLRRRRPEMDVTVRTSLSRDVIANRLSGPFHLNPEADDFGMVMEPTGRIDVAGSLDRYRALHADWEGHVARVAERLRTAQADLVLAAIPYLTLAAAKQAGIPAVAMCSLNWRGILGALTGPSEAWNPLLSTMEEAYNGAEWFLQPEPAMPMPELGNQMPIGPVGRVGEARPEALRRSLGVSEQEALVLVALGGMPYGLSMTGADARSDLHWLVPGQWAVDHPRFHTFESLAWGFPDLLSSVDAVVTKPGYATFVEAAAAGRPLVTLDRPEWPETPILLDFLIGA